LPSMHGISTCGNVPIRNERLNQEPVRKKSSKTKKSWTVTNTPPRPPSSSDADTKCIPQDSNLRSQREAIQCWSLRMKTTKKAVTTSPIVTFVL
jgi:hypothetical protein